MKQTFPPKFTDFLNTAHGLSRLRILAQEFPLWQRVKDLVLLQLWHRSQLQLGFDPWLEEPPYATGAEEIEGKKQSWHKLHFYAATFCKSLLVTGENKTGTKEKNPANTSLEWIQRVSSQALAKKPELLPGDAGEGAVLSSLASSLRLHAWMVSSSHELLINVT